MQYVAVVIPAKDEERRIASCLDAVLAASARCPVDVSVTLVADGCTDRTVPLARHFAGVEVVEIAASNVGVGRAIGVRHALRHSAVHPAGVWIANTDADSIVPADWLTQQVLRAEAGVDAVLGSVVPDPAEYPSELQRRWAHAHPAGRVTPEIYGANLGVRASAYLRAGGFAGLAEHEDVDLVSRLVASRVRYSDARPVITSARLDGRTPGGFAGYLRAEREIAASIVEAS